MGLAKRFMTSSTLSLLPVWHLRRSILPETPTKPLPLAMRNGHQQKHRWTKPETSAEQCHDWAFKKWWEATCFKTLNLKGSYSMQGITRNKWLARHRETKKGMCANARDVFVDQDCKILKHLTLLTSAHSLVRHLTSLDSIFTSATVDYSTGFIIFHDSTNEKRTKSVMYILVIRVSLSSCSILQTSCRYNPTRHARSSISLHLVEAKKIWKNGVEVSKLIWQLSLYSPTEYH